MSKHTPGPWAYYKHSWDDTSIYADHGDVRVCILRISEEDATEDNQAELEAQQVANARLIVAAPDMLETLQEVEAYAVNVSWFDPLLLDRVRALVAQLTE